MDANKHDEIIKKIEEEIVLIKKQGDEMIDEYKKMVEEYLPEAINNIVLSSIESNPEAETILNDDLRAKLKRNVEERISTAVSQASNRLDTGLKNTHSLDIKMHETEIDFAYRLKTTAKLSLENTIRLLIGLVGVLLIDAKLASENYAWRKDKGSSSLIYSIPLPNFSKFDKINFRYEKILQEYVKALFKLQLANLEKKKDQARSLWNDT